MKEKHFQTIELTPAEAGRGISLKKNYVALFLVLFLSVVLVTGCSNASGNGNTGDVNTVKSSLEDRNTDISKELSYKESMELKYAEQFCVDHYEDGYTLISIANDRRYLLIPEGKSVPEDLSEEIVILQCPADHIYLVATAAMDMFLELDALDTIRFSGQKEEGWCMQEVQDKIREGTIKACGESGSLVCRKCAKEGMTIAIAKREWSVGFEET